MRSPEIGTTTLLMLLTPPEVAISSYTIPALRHLTRIDGVSVLIYANGLDPEQEIRVRSFASNVPGVEVVSNRDRIAGARDAMVPGEKYVTEAGRSELRVGLYESAPEVWERELQALEGDLVGIIDSDFEVLDGEFLTAMRNSFVDDPELGFMSVDYSPPMTAFDSFSQQHCLIAARYHTWFALYSPRALRLCADFSFFEEVRDGTVVKYDHSALLQETLTANHHFVGKQLEPGFGWSYIHYGGFAQNRTLDGAWMRVYRFFRIGRHNGWIHRHGIPLIARLIRLGSRVAFRGLGLARFDRERMRYLFD